MLKPTNLVNRNALVQSESKHNPNEAEGKYGEFLGQLIHVFLERGSGSLLFHHHFEQLAKLGLFSSADNNTFASASTNESPHICNIGKASRGSISACGDDIIILEARVTNHFLILNSIKSIKTGDEINIRDIRIYIHILFDMIQISMTFTLHTTVTVTYQHRKRTLHTLLAGSVSPVKLDSSILRS